MTDSSCATTSVLVNAADKMWVIESSLGCLQFSVARGLKRWCLQQLADGCWSVRQVCRLRLEHVS